MGGFMSILGQGVRALGRQRDPYDPYDPYLDDPGPGFISDANGLTGQGPLAQPRSAPAPAPPMPEPPRNYQDRIQSQAPSPAPARPYDRLSEVLQSPDLNPQPKSVGRQVLAGVVDRYGGSALQPLTDKIRYGGDAARRRQQAQNQLPYATADTDYGQKQQQLDQTGDYQRLMGQYRIDQQDDRRAAQEDADFNKRVQLYTMAQDKADRAGARSYPTDIPFMGSSIPGRMQVPRGSRPLQLPAMPVPGQDVASQPPGESLYVPPPEVRARELSEAKGGELDPGTISILKEAQRRTQVGSPEHQELQGFDPTPGRRYTQEEMKHYREMAGRAMSGIMSGYNQQMAPYNSSPGQQRVQPNAIPSRAPTVTHTNTLPRFRPPGTGKSSSTSKKPTATDLAAKAKGIATRIITENPTATYAELVEKAKSTDSEGLLPDVIKAFSALKPSAEEAKVQRRQALLDRLKPTPAVAPAAQPTQPTQPTQAAPVNKGVLTKEKYKEYFVKAGNNRAQAIQKAIADGWTIVDRP